MATTKDVERLPSGKLKYRGETYPGYNKPKRLSGEAKKSAVLAKKGDEVKVVRFGDPDMPIRKEALIQFATFTENRWAEEYSNDMTYERVFGTKEPDVE